MTASFKSSRAANKQEHRAADMRLIVMDIDSTLINEEVIDLLGEEAGVGEQVAAITERAMRGEIDFKQALEERVGLLAGLGQEVFDRTFERVTFTPGALELVRAAHERGWKVGVVSGGFHEVADRIVETAGIDYCLANRLEVVDGKLTGKLAADIVTRERKLDALRSWAQELGLPLSQTVAMGDGANDIPMIQAAGTGIAFCAKPKTREAAPFAINERNLMLAMDIILRD
ncbi:MAG: phosphoserine phosphatase SerB [Collinsella bouchesdurhonensis]|nr:phosphoserine phosphatase SerB [Collinsella bouchesdurhonensis]